MSLPCVSALGEGRLVLNILLAGREMDAVVTLPFVSEVSSSFVSRRSMKRFFDLETKRRVVAEFDALEPYRSEGGSLLRREVKQRRSVIRSVLSDPTPSWLPLQCRANVGRSSS
jgi:hypothetical protein